MATRACWRAISQIRREHPSVAGIARQLGTTWRTVWKVIEPLLEVMAADPARFAGVRRTSLVEVWFGIVERQAIRRGVFKSVHDLNTKIRAFIDGWNDRSHPFCRRPRETARRRPRGCPLAGMRTAH